MVRESGGKFYLGGYQVEMDDKMPHGEIYLGDWKKIIANMPQSITIKRSEEAGFLTNTTYYRGTAIFDSAVAIPEAFVKIAKTIA
jgi:HK97 family phage major capsid protein